MHKKDKRGLNILTTTLLILIVIAATGILASIAIQFVKVSLQKNQACITASSSVFIQSSYTCYDKMKKQMNVMVERGKEDFQLEGILFKLIKEGGSDVAEIRKGHNPILELEFNEDNFPILLVYDSSGNNNHGDLVNGPVWDDGKIDKALKFDGVNDYVKVDNQTFKYKGENLTISVWINADVSETDNGAIISNPWNSQGKYSYILMHLYDGYIRFFMSEASGSYVVYTTSEVFPRNEWHHIVVTLNSNKEVKMYVDGELKKYGSHNFDNWNFNDQNLPLTIGTLFPYGSGWSGNSAHAFKGLIDEVKIFDAELSEEQIRKIYVTEKNKRVLKYREVPEAKESKKYLISSSKTVKRVSIFPIVKIDTSEEICETPENPKLPEC